MAVIDFTWTGATSTNFGTTTNWSPTTRVPGSGADNDNVFVPKQATNHILSGLDRSADNGGLGNHCGTIRVEQNSTVQIGASGNRLKLSADLIVHRGAQTFWHESLGDGATSRIIVRSPNNIRAYDLLGGADGVGEFWAVEGTAYADISAASFAGTFYIDPGIAYNNPRLFLTNAYGLTNLYQAGGYAEVTQNTNQLVWVQKGGGTLKMLGGAGVNGFFHHGGTTTWETVGVLSNLILMGGVFDTTQHNALNTMTSVLKAPGAEFIYNPARFSGTLVDIGVLGA